MPRDMIKLFGLTPEKAHETNAPQSPKPTPQEEPAPDEPMPESPPSEDQPPADPTPNGPSPELPNTYPEPEIQPHFPETGY